MRNRSVWLGIVALVAVGLVAGCATSRKTAQLGFTLPDKYANPDGMTIGKDGCIYLSMNTIFDTKHPAKILRITPRDKIEEVFTLPPHPETKVTRPLGIAFGADGNLYVADSQLAVEGAKPGSARLLRVNMKDGKAVGCDVVAVGFNMSNGVAARGDSIYVAETSADKKHPMASGVYRLKIAELGGGKPVELKGLDDPRMIVKLKTYSKEHPVGANGLCFDSKGNMYVCNFGDGEVWKVTFDANGKPASPVPLVKGCGLVSADGMHEDAEDNLWVADFLGNAVVKICSKTGTVTIVAKNAPTDGADGRLDSPSECIRRGNRVYVANIDLTYGPHKADPVHTISVIELED
jgi:sugar lactone lactonase YvrE